MNKKFHNLRGSSTYSGNQNPRWRTIFIALMLALTLGSIGPTLQAQAAPAHESVRFFMDIVSPKTTVCVGKTVSYEARVYIVHNPPLRTPKGKEISEIAIDKITVEANSQNKTVGDFLNTKKGFVTRVTGGADDLVSLSTGASSSNTAVFSFRAKKAGKTTLYFQGLAYGQYVSVTVPVNVINCKYKVQVYSKWFAGMTSVATINNAVITADETGYFAGSFDVKWVTSVLCGIKSPINTSNAKMTGRINEDGKLALKITYGQASSSGGGFCGAGISTSNFATPGELLIMADPSGGVYRQPQEAKAQNGSFRGRATITITPVQK